MKAFLNPAFAISAWLIIQTASLSADQFVNGGFESGFSGWETIGNVAVKASQPYVPTDGGHLAVFNSVNSTPNGLLRQFVATVPGRRYLLEFDVGNLSYNSLHQRLQVNVGEVIGAKTISHVSDIIDIPGPGGGATAWVEGSYQFTAEGSSVGFVFTDVSQATNSLDLVLDRVRLSEQPLPVETFVTNGSFEAGLEGWITDGNVSVRSSPPYNPTEGKKLAAFNTGNTPNSGSLTQAVLTRPGRRYRLEFDVGNLSYNSLHQRMLVQVIDLGYKNYPVVDTIDIPGPGGGATAWVAASYEFVATSGQVDIRFNDQSESTNSLDLVLDNVRVTEVGNPLLVNGGFEAGLSGWFSGGNVAINSAPPYLASEGSNLLAFNSVDTIPNGSISQTFVTVPTQRYRLEFDVGNLSYNSSHQRMMVLVVSGFNISLVADTIDIAGPGGGATAWISASYEFVAIGTSANLIFNDVSQATHSVDLVLDKVRLTQVP